MIANTSVITDNLDYLLWGRAAEGQPDGVLLTLLMAISAALLALPGGIVLACCVWRFPSAVRNGLFIWTRFIRGTPLIFVTLWMQYLLPMLTGSDLLGTITVMLALARFTAASVMYSMYAGISALPDGQYGAAVVQGFRPEQTLWLILLPQVLCNVLPLLTGVLIGLLKGTPLVFIVSVSGLTAVTGQVNSQVQTCPAAIFTFTGLVYCLLCFSLEKIIQHRFVLK